MFEWNVKLGKPYKHLSTWRKTSIGTWANASDASLYGQFDIDAGPLLQKIAAASGQGKKITIPALVGKAAAEALKQYPMINSIIRFGRIYPREEVNIFFQAYYKDEYDDLAGICIHQCDKFSAEEVTHELRTRYIQICKNKDPDRLVRRIYKWCIPGFLSRPFWALMGFILYTLNINVLFHQRDYFGSVMITDISVFDLEQAYGALLPFTRCPMILAVGAIRNKVVVINDKVVIKPTITISATLDHRLIDGAGAGRLLKTFQAALH